MVTIETSQELTVDSEEKHRDIFPAPIIGRLTGTGQSGEILVECNGSGPKTARLISSVHRTELTKPENKGREVLLVFEEGDLNRPIIIGLMDDPLERLVTIDISPPLTGGGQGEGEALAEPQPPKEALIDRKRVTIEAKEEIVLKCGSGSITLRKDGKIVIKGTHLLSRSSGPIRVKGARVDIN